MSTKHFTANVISATKVVPNGSFENSAASGVWTLDEQYDLRRGGNWPETGNVAPVAFWHLGTGNHIDSVSITTLGDASDYGDLAVSLYHIGACGNSTRVIFGGGSAGGTANDTIQYISTKGGGTCSDFGDLTGAQNYASGLANATRGIFGGGNRDGLSNDDTMSYITIGTTGNATDYGDLTQVGRKWRTCASPTRGIFAMGYSTSGGVLNRIDHMTIGSTGNASDFGDLTGTNGQSNSSDTGAGCSSNVRGLINGPNEVMTYITIASTGNATDFGDMTVSVRKGMAAASSNTRALNIAGYDGVSDFINVIDYVEIATTGNAVDFGDTTARAWGAATGNAHGGLQ